MRVFICQLRWVMLIAHEHASGHTHLKAPVWECIAPVLCLNDAQRGKVLNKYRSRQPCKLLRSLCMRCMVIFPRTA